MCRRRLLGYQTIRTILIALLAFTACKPQGSTPYAVADTKKGTTAGSVPPIAGSVPSTAGSDQGTAGSGLGTGGVISATSMAGALSMSQYIPGYDQPSNTLYANHNQYPYQGFVKYEQCFGTQDQCALQDAMKYYIFEPDHQNPQPLVSPIVVYVHGFEIGFNASCIDEMIKDWTRRGWTVIVPVYMDLSNLANFKSWSDNVTQSVRDGLIQLHKVTPKKDAAGNIVTAYIATSIGAYIATNVASQATTLNGSGGVPIPQGIIYHDAAGYDFKHVVGIDDSVVPGWRLPAATHVLFLAAENTLRTTNTVETVKEFTQQFDSCCQLVKNNHLSAFVLPNHHTKGHQLISDHTSSKASSNPLCGDKFDAVDWWMYWDQTNAHLYYHFENKYAGQLHGKTDENGITGLYNGCYTHDLPCSDEITHSYPHPMTEWNKPL